MKPRRGVFFIICLLSLSLSLFLGCASLVEKPPPLPERPPAVKPTPPPLPKAPPALTAVAPEDVPPLEDDMDLLSLERAVAGSLRYFGRLSEKRTCRFGESQYTVKEMKESLTLFLDIMRGPGSREQKERRLKESFDFFKAAGRGEKRSVLFTGYYEPILEGSFVKKTQYRHPIYEVPGDMVVANLGKFKTKFRGERIVGRVVGREVVPYYNRKEIDGDGVLANRGLEIAWLADPVDVFFLHIQGSGLVRLADGGFMQVSYAESNGRPYRGIGRLLLDQGKVTEKDLSLGGIKKYLRDNPGEMAAILNHNESYVFFRIVEEGPVGSIGVPLTGGRSIATDLELFPRGALSFIRLRKPLLDENKRITSWVGFSRFVLNQDTGGVIKGPGRADVFCGRGLEAEVFAGSLSEEGELYFLVKKKERTPR